MSLALTTGKRKIKDGSKFNKYFPPESAAYGNNTVLRNKGNVFQTVKYIAEIIKKDASDTAKIAPKLKGSTRFETLKNIHNFMIDFLQYDTESGEKLRSPRRTWWVGQTQKDKETGDTGVDCDDLVIFSGSILYNLDIPFYIRIVKINSDKFQHVYLMAPLTGKTLSGTYVTLDGVLSTFNYEYPFTHENTFDMDAVKIEYLGNLSGTDTIDDKLHNLLEFYLLQISNGSLIPTKINSGDLTKMLEYLLNNWENPKNRLQALEVLSEAENQSYKSKNFFSKLLQLEGSRLTFLSGDFGLNPDFNHDGAEDADGTWNTNTGGSRWGEAGIAFLNALANFDWGLISGNHRQQPPYPVPQPQPVKKQIAGISLTTIGSVFLIGGLSYLLYENISRYKGSNKRTTRTIKKITPKQIR